MRRSAPTSGCRRTRRKAASATVPAGEDGAVYEVRGEGGRTVWMWLPDGAAPGAPAIDPAVVARRAVDQMELKGPDITSPHAAGKSLVGMPMWMWVRPGPTTYGPASASAGGMTVTATARVTAVRWAMGDGTTVTCTGPGTLPGKRRRGRLSGLRAPLHPHLRRQARRPLHRDRHLHLDRHLARPGRRDQHRPVDGNPHQRPARCRR